MWAAKTQVITISVMLLLNESSSVLYGVCHANRQCHVIALQASIHALPLTRPASLASGAWQTSMAGIALRQYSALNQHVHK